MRKPIAPLLILFTLGALLAGAAELTYGGWIQIPILSIVWWQLSLEQSRSLKHYFLLSLAFGIGYFVVGLWWLYISMHDVGGMNALLSCAAVFLLSSYLAIYIAGACASIRIFNNTKFMGLLLAATWVIF